MLPEEVLEKAAAEMLCYEDSGMSVMEMSHRSPVYEKIIADAESKLRQLMQIPDNYKVLFLQGGASTQFAAVPLNLLPENGKADYILSGQFSTKAYQEAKKYGDVACAASTKEENFSRVPQANELKFRDGIDYVGLDPYVNDVDRIGSLMDMLAAIPGNFPHVAENGGDYYNNDVMTLKALSKGSGYEVFEVVTTPDPQLADWTLRGVYNPDFTQKGQTQRLINAYAIFKGAWYDFATADVNKIHPFNVVKSDGQEKTSETASLESGSLTWSTTSRGIAFAIEGDGYITVASTKADRLTFSQSPRSAEMGHYDKTGKWLSEGVVSVEGGVLAMEAVKVYRIIP